MARNAGSILAALLGGIVVGGVAALLLAPSSGKELREKVAEIVREKASHLNKEEFDAFIEQVMAKVKDYFNDEEIKQIVEEELKLEEKKA